MKTIKNNIIIRTIVLLLLVVCYQPLRAQTKYTVLLPTIDVTLPSKDRLVVSADKNGVETEKSFFKFNAAHLPGNAKIERLNLQLYKDAIADTELDFSSHTITILKGPPDWNGEGASEAIRWANLYDNPKGLIGRCEIVKSTKSVNIKLRLPEKAGYVSDFLPGKVLSMAARSPEKDQRTVFHSSKSAMNGSFFSAQPKLIVTYEIDPYPFRQDWSQPNANAQHSGATVWKTNTFVASARARKVGEAQGEFIQQVESKGAIAIYKNNPVVFTQPTKDAAAGFMVKQLNARGEVLWKTGVDNPARSLPVIDEWGRLYYISTAGKLTVINMEDKGKVLSSDPLTKISGNTIATINRNAAIGYDGTLYLTSGSSVIALSAYPEFKLRWKYTSPNGEICSAVSLSKDESKAYFISVNTNQDRFRLVALDNFDGNLSSVSDYEPGGYKSGTGSLIPPPVLLNNETAFVLDGFDSGNVLYIYDIKNKIIKSDSLLSAAKPGGGISQPVINSSGVYFIHNKKLVGYSASDKLFEVKNTPSILDNGSVLVSDGGTNLYAVDPYSAQKMVYGFKLGDPVSDAFSMAIDNTIGNVRKDIILAADGTLYIANEKDLVAVTPTLVGEKYVTINQPALKTNMLYRSQDAIIFEPLLVEPSIDAIFSSAGTIIFKKGLSIKKGAQIKCKTGL